MELKKLCNLQEQIYVQLARDQKPNLVPGRLLAGHVVVQVSKLYVKALS